MISQNFVYQIGLSSTTLQTAKIAGYKVLTVFARVTVDHYLHSDEQIKLKIIFRVELRQRDRDDDTNILVKP